MIRVAFNDGAFGDTARSSCWCRSSSLATACQRLGIADGRTSALQHRVAQMDGGRAVGLARCQWHQSWSQQILQTRISEEMSTLWEYMGSEKGAFPDVSHLRRCLPRTGAFGIIIC